MGRKREWVKLMKRINQDEYWIKYKTRLKEKGKISERVFEDERCKNFFGEIYKFEK